MRLLKTGLPVARQHVALAIPVALVVPGTLPFVVGAASILALTGGGLYWTVGGIIGALLGASVNAWVLLVEILR